MSDIAFNYIEYTEDAKLRDAVGLEGFSSLSDFLSGAKASITKTLKQLFNTDTPTIEQRPHSTKELMAILKGKQYEKYRKLTVFVPSQMDEYVPEFIGDLHEQISAMSDITTRLYEPLIKWFSITLNDPAQMDKLWVDRSLRTVDTAKLRKQLGKNFASELSSSGDPTSVPLEDAYQSFRKIDDAYVLLDKTADTAIDVDLDVLAEKEKRLVSLIDRFIEVSATLEIDTKKPLIKKLVATVDAVALETEYLSALLYLINISIAAHNQTVDKLTYTLKSE